MSTRHSSDHHSQGRLARRWKRRLRIAAPFLSVPLLLGTLMLSVDLIEYRPAEPPRRLSDRPIPPASERAALDDAASRQRVSMASVVEPGIATLADPRPLPPSALELELDLRLPRLDLSPAAPSARP